MKNVVDAAGWIEYVSDGAQAGFFAPAIEKTADLLVPSVVLLEVFRILVRQVGEGPALEVAAAMRQATVAPLDATLALEAARLAALHQLDASGGAILATVGQHEATLWTADSRFAYLPNVRYRELLKPG